MRALLHLCIGMYITRQTSTSATHEAKVGRGVGPDRVTFSLGQVVRGISPFLASKRSGHPPASVYEQHSGCYLNDHNIIYSLDIPSPNRMESKLDISIVGLASFKNIESSWRRLLRPECVSLPVRMSPAT